MEHKVSDTGTGGEAAIEGMLTDLMYEIDLETLEGGTAAFIQSLHTSRRERGYLTEKQEAALHKVYREFMA